MEDKLNSNSTIGTLVNRVPGSATVLEELGMDYYCHGDSSLAEICAQTAYDPDEILEGIYNIIPEKVSRQERDLSKAPTHRMLDHITEEHYGFVLGPAPLLTRLINQVITRHGKSHPDLIDLGNLFALLCEELGRHMLEEEKTLYKLVRQFELGVEAKKTDIILPEGQIIFLKQEHWNAIKLIENIKKQTNGYCAPEYACPTYRLMLKKLKKLELDLHRHIHEENNIIYPRVF